MRSFVTWVAVLFIAVWTGWPQLSHFLRELIPADSVSAKVGDNEQTPIDGTLPRPAQRDSASGPETWYLNAVSSPDEDVIDTPTQRPRGWAYPRNLVLGARGDVTALSDIASGILPDGPPGDPGELVPFELNETCTARRPKPGERVHNVRLEASTTPTRLHAFNNAQLSETLVEHLEGVAKHSRHSDVGKRVSARMGVVDVFVTETAAPVYLVLQSWMIYNSPDIIWNIHLAPGAELAHVVMIGDHSGLVLPDETVSFEAMRIDDFIRNQDFEANEAPRPCMIIPFRKPQKSWRAFQMATEDNDLMVNHVYYFNTGYRVFNAWYQETFGVDASTNLITEAGASHVRVGPKPTDPVPYRPLEGARIHVTATDHIVVGDEQWTAVHRDVLTRAAGGDLALFDPAPREVEAL